MPNSDSTCPPDAPGSDLRYFVTNPRRIKDLDLSGFSENSLWAVLEFEDLVRLAHPSGYGSVLTTPWTQGVPPSGLSFMRTRKERADRLRRYLSRIRFTLGKEWSPQQEDAWGLLGDLNDLLNLLQRMDRGAGGKDDELTLALRSHGRLTKQDRLGIGLWGAPLELAEPAVQPFQPTPAQE